jgi:aryl-alcohol dehydrogenase (NADP+)
VLRRDEPPAVGPRTLAKHILDAIDGSLRRLRTDYVDLYQAHHPDPDTPIDETLRALDDVVRAGKARYVGCSNYHAYQVARARPQRAPGPGALRLRAAALQPLLFRQPGASCSALPRRGRGGDSVQSDRRWLAVRQASARERTDGGHAVHAGQRRAALPGPVLARARVRHDRGAPPAGRRGRHAAGATGDGVGAGQPAITAPIVGASRPEQLDDILAAADKDSTRG